MSEYFTPLTSEALQRPGGCPEDMFQAFRNFNNEIFEKESALPRKVKGTYSDWRSSHDPVPYCIESHVKAAKKAGATDREIAEAIFVTAALRAGGAFAHSIISTGVLKEMDRLEKGKIEISNSFFLFRDLLFPSPKLK